MPIISPYKMSYLWPAVCVLLFGALLAGILFPIGGNGRYAEKAVSATGQVPPSAYFTKIDLGPQLPDQLLHDRLRGTNSESATVHFSQLITSCGCLSGVLYPSAIPAGKTGTLTLTLATPDWAGTKVVTALLYGTMGSASADRRYVVTYSVHRMIRVTGWRATLGEAYYLDLGSILVGSMLIPFQVTITRGSYPVRWDTLRCSTNTKYMATRLVRNGKRRWLLSVVPKDLTMLGSQSYVVRFSFYCGNRELNYHLSLPVNFTVRGPVAIEPDSIFFGAVPYDSTVIKNLQLVTSTTGQIGKGRILSATSTDPGHAAVAVTGGGKGLRATFHAVGTQGRSTGRFLITARYGGSQYQFRVDYLAYVLGKGGKK